MKKILAIAIVVGAAFWVLPTDAEAGQLKFPWHGNWCGPGHGGGEPKDALDEACKRHDECYEKEGYFNCKKCDEQLIDEISGLQEEDFRALAGIRLWFKSEHRPCRVRGIPVPGFRNPVPEPEEIPGEIFNRAKRLLCGIWC